ncbi:MAG: hypothetical protein NTY47_07480, partial [Candidatus Omnitrophica bacterium]|nr:hypothetical protein [Candidatus Omnitrophota bacterium]
MLTEEQVGVEINQKQTRTSYFNAADSRIRQALVNVRAFLNATGRQDWLGSLDAFIAFLADAGHLRAGPFDLFYGAFYQGVYYLDQSILDNPLELTLTFLHDFGAYRRQDHQANVELEREYRAEENVIITFIPEVHILFIHIKDLVERKLAHVKRVIAVMYAFINHDFESLYKTFDHRLGIDEQKYFALLERLYSIYQALSDEGKDVLRVVVVFHDLGAIKGRRDWEHHKIGSEKVKEILQGLGYESGYIKRVSRIIWYHGFYGNMGTDFLPRDFLKFNEEDKDILLLMAIFDAS